MRNEFTHTNGLDFFPLTQSEDAVTSDSVSIISANTVRRSRDF
jgi:hypothetical protein